MIDYNTPFETVAMPRDANETRKVIVANALSVVGINASKPETFKMFEDLLGPVSSYWDLKRPFRVWKENGKWKTEGVSTCGLVARGLWRRVAVDMPKIYKDYDFGMAMIDEQNFCRSLKPRSAWYTPKKDDETRPLPGDYVIIGSGLTTHNFTCIGWDGDKMISVDGGRVDKKTGLQCIEHVERELVTIGGNLCLKDDHLIRRIVGWAQVDLLPYRSVAVAPQGWQSVYLG